MKHLALTLYLVCLLQAQSGTTNSWPFPPEPHPTAISGSLIQSDKFDEALQDLKKRIEADKEDGQLWANLTVALLEKGENTLASEACRKAVRYGQSDKLPLLVFLLNERGQIDEARCLVPLLEQLSAEASVGLSSRTESIVLLVSYAIATGDENGAIARLSRIETFQGWEKALAPVTVSWLASQAEVQGFIKTRDRLRNLSMRFPSVERKRPAQPLCSAIA